MQLTKRQKYQMLILVAMVAMVALGINAIISLLSDEIIFGCLAIIFMLYFYWMIVSNKIWGDKNAKI